MSLQGPVHPSNNRPLSSIQKLTRTLLSCSYPYSKRGNLRTCSSISRIHIITHRRSTVRMYHQIIEQTFIQIEITSVESSYFSTHPPSAKLCCHQRFASISFFLPFFHTKLQRHNPAQSTLFSSDFTFFQQPYIYPNTLIRASFRSF